jgi:integrase
MTYLDDVKQYVIKLKKYKWTDKTKAEHIKEYILNIDGIADGTKKDILVKIKPFVIDNNILNDPQYVILINSKELYNKIIKESDAKRDDKPVINIDMDIIDKLLKLKCDKKLNPANGEFIIDKYSLFIYLLFTSGLRTNEITENEFSIIDKNTIKAKRISKTLNDDNNKPTNLINLLIPSTEWIALFNNLQKQIKENDIYKPSTIGTGIKRKLANIHSELHAHALRKLYLAYHLQIKKTGTDNLPSVNTKKLLNHSNENASIYYNGAVKITGDLADVIDNTDYSKMKIIELKAVLTSKNISFKSNMKKAELIKLITSC